MERITAKMQYLHEHELFRDFDQEEMAQMERAIVMVIYAAGEQITNVETGKQTLFILKWGTVQLYRLTMEERKIVVATLEAGTIFGEMALLGQTMKDTYAETLTPAKVCLMSQQDVQRLLLQKPQMALRLLSILLSRLRQTERRVEQIAFVKADYRLAEILLSLSCTDNEIIGFSHQSIADMMGVYRETVTITLNAFKTKGWVELGRKRIRITDRAALETIVLKNLA